MNKSHLIAAGFTEVTDAMTVAELKAFASEKGISLVTPNAPPADSVTAPVAVKELPKHPLQEQAEAEIAAMKPTAAPKEISEEEIIAKIRAGLTRDQAIEVILTQRAHDKALAEQG